MFLPCSHFFCHFGNNVYLCTHIHRMLNHKKGAVMPLFYNKVQRVNPRDPEGV